MGIQYSLSFFTSQQKNPYLEELCIIIIIIVFFLGSPE